MFLNYEGVFQFVWTWDSGEGDQYGDYLNKRWYYDDVISSLSGYVRSEIETSYRYRIFENNINRILRDLPSMQNSGLIESKVATGLKPTDEIFFRKKAKDSEEKRPKYESREFFNFLKAFF